MDDYIRLLMDDGCEGKSQSAGVRFLPDPFEGVHTTL